MSNDPTFLQSLEEERSRLRAELERVPAYARLQVVDEAIKALKNAYGITGVAHVTMPHVTVVANGRVFSAPNQISGTIATRGGLTSVTVELARQHMATTGRRLRSGQLVELLAAKGIHAVGKKPQASVASILSHHPDFDNANDEHGIGYGLKEWSGAKSQTEPAPPVLEAPVQS